MRIVIGLVGENGAGKGTAVSVFTELIKPHNVLHVSTSGFLSETLKQWHIESTRENLLSLTLIMDKEFGIGSLGRALKERVQSSNVDFVLFDCIRLQSDYDMVRSFTPNFVWYVTADEKIRWKRIKMRARGPDDNRVTLRQFRTVEHKVTAVPLHIFGQQADYVTVNDGSKEEMKEAVQIFVGLYAKPALQRQV